MTSCILVVDDEKAVTDLLAYNLRKAHYDVLVAADGRTALRLARESRPDLILLDLMLPEVDGLDVCRELRRTSAVPIIMITARGEEIDRVVGLELGADDYVTKPFSVRELVLRLKAVLRRSAPGRPAERPPEAVGPIHVDVDAHRAYVDGAEIQLTPLEFRLLTTLMARLGRVQSREQLLEDVWQMSSEVETRTVDTHVKRLREKLGSGRDLLQTVRGVGYRLVDPDAKE
jgi:two-component system phosphate regulon response regulator PhoB